MNKERYRLSALAAISLVISLSLCYIIISNTIKNRIYIEDLYIEQLILEKSLLINDVLSKLMYKTEILAAMVVQGHGNIDDFDRIAPSIVDDPVIRNVLLAPDGYVTKVYPLEENKSLLGFYLFDNAAGNNEAIAARDLGRFVFGGPFELHQGGSALVGRKPVYIETPDEAHKFWGIASVTIKFPEILDYADLEIFSKRNFLYELWRVNPDTGQKQIIASNLGQHTFYPHFISKKVEIIGANWQFDVSPILQWYDYPANIIMIIVGFLVSFLVMFVLQHNFELKNMKSTLEIMTMMDTLTGIYNRRYMEEHLKQIVKTISRSGGTLSLLMIDVDFFKNYNDTYGHDDGDICLKNIAETIARNLLRPEDFVARYGGEEFVVVLPNTTEEGAKLVSERLLECIRDCKIPHEKSDVADHVTISIGVTTGKVEQTFNMNSFIKWADKALYASKQTGRNKYTFAYFEDQN